MSRIIENTNIIIFFFEIRKDLPFKDMCCETRFISVLLGFPNRIIGLNFMMLVWRHRPVNESSKNINVMPPIFPVFRRTKIIKNHPAKLSQATGHKTDDSNMYTTQTVP